MLTQKTISQLLMSRNSLVVQSRLMMSTRVMRAITVDPTLKNAAASDLRVSEVPLPEVAEGEYLVKVRATAVNRADIL